MIILGIETSCDETACAIVQDGRKLLCTIVASQMDEHASYGGVVPELASRRHVELLIPVIRQALAEANLTLQDITAIGVTNRPGLLGALLVGVTSAKALGQALGIPVIPVHHIEAHLYANFIAHPEMEFPATALVVSGGHTDLFDVESHGVYRLLGRTRDDAAGEAFDKCARLMGLPYPGGPSIQEAAKSGDPKAIAFPRALMHGTHAFSFSGLKTAVKYALVKPDCPPVPDVAASFQAAVVDVLVRKTIAAAKECGRTTVVLAGGVAANTSLKEAMEAACNRWGMCCYIPPPSLCTDNAAMIATTASYHFMHRPIPSLDFAVIPSEPLSSHVV
jgi:N6-L-threonylcarbamoyladenine synthase